MHRRVPELVIGTLLVALLASYVVYTHRVVRDLQAEARRASQRYARVFRAQSDTSESASTQAMLDLARSIREQGVPLIVTNLRGEPTDRKSTRLNSSHTVISYAVFCLKKKKKKTKTSRGALWR